MGRHEQDLEAIRPCLGYAPLKVIKFTLENTTQYARNSVRLPFRNHYKSRFPALNVRRRNEPVATDTLWADTPAIGCGSTCAQVFVGRATYVTDVYGCRTDGEFASLLEENIRQRGAMDLLISDSAKVIVSGKVQDILRMYSMKDFQSEPHNQHQNFAERRIGTLKEYTNRVLDRTGAPGEFWLLCLQYVAGLLNSMANKTLGWKTPLSKLTGVTPDISAYLGFHFYQKVLYAVDNGWPSESKEKSGRWVGIAENVGDALTYKVLTDDTKRIITRSAVRPRDDSINPNHRVTTVSPEVEKGTGRTVVQGYEDANGNGRAIQYDPDELIGRTFLQTGYMPEEVERRYIAEKIVEIENGEEKISFLTTLSDGESEELLAYNEIVDILERQRDAEINDPDQKWIFKNITDHAGPFTRNSPEYKGSKWNVLVNWEGGAVTWEPLDTIAADDPVTCAQYAQEHDLLKIDGWKRFKRLVKNAKVFQRMLNQTKLKSIRYAPIFKNGFEVPRSHKHAMELDAKNGNTRWRDAENTELSQIMEYNTFEDKGLGARFPPGYKQIRCHFVYDVKHDGRHKARYVAGGHMTDPPLESVYSGVVTLRSLRLVIFLAELNGFCLFACDVGNAYLEARTKEKICVIGGDEFRDFGLVGHTLIVIRALYGLKTSGARWHERFADTLREEGFTPCKADPDVWMRKTEGLYEYICVYVDDLAMAMKEPAKFCELLKTKHNYKLKGDGPLKYHLGCDFGRDPDGTYYYGPYKYVDKMLESYERLFGEKPAGAASPLVKGDHPECDTSDICSDTDRAIYMSLIGQCQWLVSLGRFDIAVAVMTMSRYRAEPRVGHMTRMKRVYGYLRQYPKGAIRVRTDIPDQSGNVKPKYDWAHVYGNVKEELPHDMPEPLGKPVITTTFVDANLYHDYLSGRSVTGALHMVNQTPVEWYTKRQATVETATYGSEFNAARTATEQIMDLRYTLRMLGVPIITSNMYGDNQSVLTNSTIPHSQLSKRHNALAYHRVREAIAADILNFFYVNTKKNCGDVLSKIWGHADAWPLLQPLLFWRGDTIHVPNKGE